MKKNKDKKKMLLSERQHLEIFYFAVACMDSSPYQLPSPLFPP
jgi:hypothetical protein